MGVLMALFLVKLNLGILAVTIGLGFLSHFISSNLWQKYNNDKNKRNELLEYSLLNTLKAFTVMVLFSLFSLTLSIPVITYYLWLDIQTLPGEMAFGITIIMAMISISGILAFILAIRKRRMLDEVYIKADLFGEPTLYDLVLSLGKYFEVNDVKSVRITPGSDISLREHVETFDHVFYGGDKIIEIGLSSMELLSASDLKVLLARQFAQYVDSDNPPIALIKRLKAKTTMMNDNIMSGGFLLTLNPIAWIVMAAHNVIDYVTNDYQTMAEYQADQIVIEYSGTNRLTHALARFGVETELYKDLIDIVEIRERENRIPFEGNIYDSMRRAQAETTGQLRTMVDHLFQDATLSGGDIGKKTLKLRLNKLPETPSIPIWEINRPAIAFLRDWRNTENRMLKLLRS